MYLKQCPKCGWKNEIDVHFCGNCAQDLTAEEMEDTLAAGYEDDFEQYLAACTDFVYEGRTLVRYEGKAAKVEILPGTKVVGPNAFAGNSTLREVIIPQSVTEMGEWAFDECDGLVEMDYAGTLAQWCRIVFDFGGNPLERTHRLRIRGKEIVEVTPSDGLSALAAHAFHGCAGLKRVVLPAGVTEIGESALRDCVGLTEVVLPMGLTKIGDQALAGCAGLTDVRLPEGVTEIGDGAFDGCTGLTTMVVPKKVARIGAGTFADCTALTEVVLQEGVRKIVGHAFTGCVGLQRVRIPLSVREMGAEAFLRCGNVRICCAAPSKPDGWHDNWSKGLAEGQVIWSA